MKKISLVLFILTFTIKLSAQVVTKTIDNYGVKFIVAEKVPLQLLFLMGSYNGNEKNNSLNLKVDGTGSLNGKMFKYWFECSENNFISKKPFLDEGNYPFNNISNKQNDYDYNIINIIIEYSDHNYKNPLSVSHILINFKLKKAIIINYEKTINGIESDFNIVTKVAPIAPQATEAKEFSDSISIQEKPAGDNRSYFDYNYETRLMNMAGADVIKESREAATEKISKWWYKYKTLFFSQSSSFNLEKGSVLKFAVAKGFAPFLETIVGTYQMDINFIDPADNRNVLDYVNDEILTTTKTQGADHAQVRILKEYKQLLLDLGGKPSK